MLVRALVEGGPQAVASTPAQVTIGEEAATIASASPKRKTLIIQNTGTTVIKLVLGAVDPTQTVYHVALKGGTAPDDGLGASYFDEGWVGEVRAISSAAGGTLVVTEMRVGNPDWNLARDGGTL